MKLTVTVDLGEVDEDQAWIALLTAFEHAAKVVEVQRNATAGTATLRGVDDALEHRVEWRAATESLTPVIDGLSCEINSDGTFVFGVPEEATYTAWGPDLTEDQRFAVATWLLFGAHEGVDNAAEPR